MSKKTEKLKMLKKDLLMNILTDPYFLPTTKLILVYFLELKGMHYIENNGEVDFNELSEILHISKQTLGKAKKQLLELEVLREKQ